MLRGCPTLQVSTPSLYAASIVAKYGAEATNRELYDFGLTEESECWMLAGGGKSIGMWTPREDALGNDGDTIRRDTGRRDVRRCGVII